MLMGFVAQWNNFIEKFFQALLQNDLEYVITDDLHNTLVNVGSLPEGIAFLPFPTIVVNYNNEIVQFNEQFLEHREKLNFSESLSKGVGKIVDYNDGVIQNLTIDLIDSNLINDLSSFDVKVFFYPIFVEEAELTICVFLIDTNQIEKARYLRETIKELKIILENISYIIYIKDIFGRIIAINHVFEEKFNLLKVNIEGRFVDAFFPQELIAECIKKEREIIYSKKPVLGSEERFAINSKNELITLVDRIPILDSFGKVIGILVFAYDLTEKKQRENELRHWKKRFDLVTTATAQAVFERDWDSGEVIWTENIQQLLGYSPQELRMREKWLEKIHPGDLDTYLRQFQIHCESLTPYSFTFRVKNTAGEFRFVKETGFFLCEGNKIISIVGIISDITNQKDLEQKISDYNMFLHVLLDTIPMPIFYENIEGKIIGCNKVFQEQILTLSKKEFLGKTIDSFKQIFTDSFIENHKRTNREIIENKSISTAPYDEILFLKDGTSKHFAIYKSGYKDFDGNLSGIINILIDISERKKAEESLRNINLELEKKIEERTKDLQLALEEYRFEVEEHRRVQEILEQANFELKILNDTLAEESQKLLVLNKKLEESERELREANSAKDKFFTIIAHDLKNPLQSILTEAEILERFFDTFEKDKIREYVHHIFKTSNLLKNLLENLLTWAKTQTRRISFRPEWVDMDLVLSDVVRQLEPTASSKEIDIIYSPKANVMSFIDRNLVTIVVRNLLTNAIKFSRRGGKVRLRAEEINEKNIPSIRISVEDEGIGIPLERLNKLFKIEFSSTTPGTEKEQGTGLGLVICKELIELHKGRIWAESKENQGSTFTFVIPINFD